MLQQANKTLTECWVQTGSSSGCYSSSVVGWCWARRVNHAANPGGGVHTAQRLVSSKWLVVWSNWFGVVICRSAATKHPEHPDQFHRATQHTNALLLLLTTHTTSSMGQSYSCCCPPVKELWGVQFAVFAAHSSSWHVHNRQLHSSSSTAAYCAHCLANQPSLVDSAA